MLPTTITTTCSDFISESNPPLYRVLPKRGEGFRKIKIRRKARHTHQFEQYFDDAFGSQYKDMRLRSLIAHTREPQNVAEDNEIFYVFPPNGYKLLFAHHIENFDEYISSLGNMLNRHSESASDLLKRVFEFTYQRGSITEAAETGADVMIFDIQSYYAIRKSLIVDYNKFVIS